MDSFWNKLLGKDLDGNGIVEMLSENNTYLIGIALGAVAGVFTTFLVSRLLSSSGDDIYLSKDTKIEMGYEFDDKQEYRMMLVVRNDLKMGKGKIAAQCSHAAVMAYDAVLKKRPYLLKPWLRNGTAKIAVRVDSEEEMLDLEQKARALRILTKLVRDAGHTQVAPLSRTVLALGPAPRNVLDKITGYLKLL